MKKNKITFILTELMLIVLAAFFIIRIFSDNESMKRVAVIVEDSGDKRWDASTLFCSCSLISSSSSSMLSIKSVLQMIRCRLLFSADCFNPFSNASHLLSPGKETKTMLNQLQGERPFILINEDTYAEEPSGYASVKPDNYKIGQMLAERLIQDDEEQLENKKIGVILGKAETEESVDRIAGLKDGLEGSGCEILWEYNYARGNQNTSEIIASKKQVDYLVILDNWALEEVGEDKGNLIFFHLLPSLFFCSDFQVLHVFPLNKELPGYVLQPLFLHPAHCKFLIHILCQTSVVFWYAH